MDEEERLQQLMAAVRQYPDGTHEWRRAMSRLLIVLQGLPEYRKYASLDCPDYCLDALNQTWEWLSRNIRNFEPRTASIRTDLVRWINGYLYWRIRDSALPDYPEEAFSLDEIIQANSDEGITTWLERVSEQRRLLGTAANPHVLSGIENYIEQSQRQKMQRLAQKLALYIERDPDRKLRDCHPRKYPKCNCHLLSQRLLFIFKNPPDKLSDLAREFQIPYQTLVSHWKLKGLPLLREIATEFGEYPTN